MKKVYAAFIAAALALMLLPCALMPFVPSSLGAENRLPAEWPALKDEDGFNFDFPAQYEDWLRDHVALRNVWIGAYAGALRAVGTSSEEQVLLGKGDWLFFRETLNDYAGLDVLSEDEIARLALTLNTVDEALRARGSRLILAVVPNKASVYPEFMNAAYPCADAPGNAERLAAAVRVRQVPLFDVLRAHASEGLYFHMDTHWNALGARYGARAILEALGEETGVNIALPDPQAEYEVREDWRSDLIRMLNPYTETCEAQMYYADRPAFRYRGRVRSPEDLTIQTTGGAAPLKVLVLRDSFSNLLLEELSGAIGDVTYLRAMPLPLDQAEGTDAVVLEIVERRLKELLDAPPVMKAMETDAPASLSAARLANVRLEREDGGGSVRLFGALEDAPSGLTEVCVGVRAAGVERWYAAFPISGVADDGDDGFSALLDELPEDAQVCVLMNGAHAVRSEWVDLPAG